jgi:hypothetical protein
MFSTWLRWGKALITPSLPHAPIPAQLRNLLTHVNNLSHHLTVSVASLRLYSFRRNGPFTSSEYAWRYNRPIQRPKLIPESTQFVSLNCAGIDHKPSEHPSIITHLRPYMRGPGLSTIISVDSLSDANILRVMWLARLLAARRGLGLSSSRDSRRCSHRYRHRQHPQRPPRPRLSA